MYFLTLISFFFYFLLFFQSQAGLWESMAAIFRHYDEYVFFFCFNPDLRQVGQRWLLRLCLMFLRHFKNTQ